MQAFGITFDKYSIPIIYLACSAVGFLLMRESIHMLQHPIATRAISVILEVGFIFLALPAIFSIKTIDISRKALFLLILWLAWTLASTILGNQPWAAMARWFEILTSILTALCIWLIVRERTELATILAKGIIAALLLCIFAFVAYWIISPSPVQHNWVTDIPLFVNIRHFGYLPAAALPLGYWLLELSSGEKRQISSEYLPIKSTNLVLIYLTLCWALVFWLGGRGAFLSVTIVTFIYFSLSKHNIMPILATIIFGLMLSQLFIVDVPNLNLLRFLDLFLNGAEKDLNRLSSSRIAIYYESIIHWWNNAPIFGIGADGYRYIIPAIIGIDVFFHPHNSIVQLLMSYGLPGLFIPCCLFFSFTLRLLSNTNKRHLVFSLSILSSLFLSLVDGILYHAYGLFISTILVGIGLAYVWPKTLDKVAINRGDRKKLTLRSLFVLLLASTSIYYSVFIYQLYHSKYGCVDESWINWNAQYPIYFSPTWSYERYSIDEIEDLKKIYAFNKKNHSCFN